MGCRSRARAESFAFDLGTWGSLGWACAYNFQVTIGVVPSEGQTLPARLLVRDVGRNVTTCCYLLPGQFFLSGARIGSSSEVGSIKGTDATFQGAFRTAPTLCWRDA